MNTDNAHLRGTLPTPSTMKKWNTYHFGKVMQPLSRQGLAGQTLECEEGTDGTEGGDWAGPFEAWFPYVDRTLTRL